MVNHRRAQVYEVGLGERIKTARTGAKLRQREIAQACRVSIPAVSDWENGHSAAPASALVEIARLTSVDLTWLLTGRPPQGFPSVSIGERGTAVPKIALKQVHDIDNARKSATSFMTARHPVGPRAFALTVQDRSNADVLRVGDECVFDPDIEPQPERFVLALIGKDRHPVIRCYEERGDHMVLVPMNKAWKETVLRNSRDGTIVATLVEFCRAM